MCSVNNNYVHLFNLVVEALIYPDSVILCVLNSFVGDPLIRIDMETLEQHSFTHWRTPLTSTSHLIKYVSRNPQLAES